jgi:ubiquinone/menaquinone biosynthesis C-methylase UbiE
VSVAPKYDRIAPIYELIDLPLELLIFKKWRREALSRLNGKILEVGVGTGRNMKYYPPCCLITGVDNSKGMLGKARENTKNMKNVTFYSYGRRKPWIFGSQLRLCDYDFCALHNL